MGLTFWKRAQFVILASTATYLSLVPQPGEAFATAPDKFLHVLCWFMLLLSLRLAVNGRRFPVLAAAALFVYSVVVEVGQYWVPNRTFSGLDILANGAGVILGLLLVRGCERLLLTLNRNGSS